MSICFFVKNYMRVALQKADSGCTAKTLQVRPYATTEEVCRLCALKFRVSDPENYGLFLFTEDSSQQLAADTHPQWIKAELHSRPKRQHFYFVYRTIADINCSMPVSSKQDIAWTLNSRKMCIKIARWKIFCSMIHRLNKEWWHFPWIGYIWVV